MEAHMTKQLTLLVAAVLAALGLAGSSVASSSPIVIGFEKDCPGLTCQETSNSPVDVVTEITPGSFAGGIFHYTATETFSSVSGSVTVGLAGIVNYNAEPDFTVLHGLVMSGSWNSVQLEGAAVHAEAIRVAGTTFAGSVTILPASAG
jgi:hypothetical protein